MLVLCMWKCRKLDDVCINRTSLYISLSLAAALVYIIAWMRVIKLSIIFFAKIIISCACVCESQEVQKYFIIDLDDSTVYKYIIIVYNLVHAQICNKNPII